MGLLLYGSRPLVPLDLIGYSFFAVELIPQSTVHEGFTTEYLFIVSWALIIFVAVLAKELLKILPVKVKDSLTAEVF